jgi:hypothetical protein
MGHELLSSEEATRLGFPPIQLSAQVQAESWDASVYAGLRQFHQGKGFDPDSQDVARHLGLPILQISTEADPPIAYSKPTHSIIHHVKSDKIMSSRS